jgi:hypothetical protein
MPRAKKENKILEEDNFSLTQFNAFLRFAYCPAEPLVLNSLIKNNSEEYKELSKGLDSASSEYLSGAMRYFYVCYCIEIEDFNKDANNYLYFQLFSQVGDQQSAALPIYGFYTFDSIMTVIKDIDSMFSVENYNKQIFDTFQNDLFGTADQVIKLMQDWTALKLINFNDLYFQDESAIKNLSNLINYNKKNTRKKTIKKNNIKTLNKTKTRKANQKLKIKNEQQL